MEHLIALYSLVLILAAIGAAACLKGLVAAFRWIRVWIDLREIPSYEVFKDAYVREECKSEYDRLDYRNYFWSF